MVGISLNHSVRFQNVLGFCRRVNGIWFSGRKSTCNAGNSGSPAGLRGSPQKRKWQPTPVFFPGKSHGQRSLTGYDPSGHKELDMIEHIFMQLIPRPGVRLQHEPSGQLIATFQKEWSWQSTHGSSEAKIQGLSLHWGCILLTKAPLAAISNRDSKLKGAIITVEAQRQRLCHGSLLMQTPGLGPHKGCWCIHCSIWKIKENVSVKHILFLVPRDWDDAGSSVWW